MITPEIKNLIEQSIPLGVQQSMLDTALKVDEFITRRYPLRECRGCGLLKRTPKEFVDDFSSVGWSLYFGSQDIHDSRENLIRDDNQKKLWVVSVSLRGPFITAEFYPWKYHGPVGTSICGDNAWVLSPSHEDPDMMAFCEEIARIFDIHYVEFEDLINIKVDMSLDTTEMWRRLDFTPEWDVDAFKMLFQEY